MNICDVENWKSEIKDFKEKTAEFHSGKISKGDYKKISGKFGSYSQRDGKAHMIRLRMTAGSIPKKHMKFIANTVKKYNIDLMHFTTCQTIQLHNLSSDIVGDIVEEALSVGIVTLGGGGDYPRNVMCSPLSGVEKEEYFNVKPWAEAASDYLLTFINAPKMPRKLKVGFSNNPDNLTHATYRDLGFVARADGKFDVYSAGGLGPNPKWGIRVAEEVEPSKILYYIKAMWLTFVSHGNYNSRVKARTRYMPDALGGVQEYIRAYSGKLREAFADGEDLTISVKEEVIYKKGDGTVVNNKRVLEQKQIGLYTVIWHPIGGKADPNVFCRLYETIADMDDVELRLSPDETVYIINLTGGEAEKVLTVTSDSAGNEFERSVSCIGASVCQIGLRDSQALLNSCIEKVRAENIPDGALPQIHISGCPSSCGTHQTGVIGFRGAVKVINKIPESAYILYVNGNESQNREAMGKELGMILESRIPDFLVDLGKTVAKSGMDFYEWHRSSENAIQEAAEKYILK